MCSREDAFIICLQSCSLLGDSLRLQLSLGISAQPHFCCRTAILDKFAVVWFKHACNAPFSFFPGAKMLVSFRSHCVGMHRCLAKVDGNTQSSFTSIASPSRSDFRIYSMFCQALEKRRCSQLICAVICLVCVSRTTVVSG